MTVETKSETTPEMIIAAGVFNALEPVQNKIKEEHPEARFKLNNRYELLVFTAKGLSETEKDSINQYLNEVGGSGLSLHNLQDFSKTSRRLSS